MAPRENCLIGKARYRKSGGWRKRDSDSHDSRREGKRKGKEEGGKSMAAYQWSWSVVVEKSLPPRFSPEQNSLLFSSSLFFFSSIFPLGLPNHHLLILHTASASRLFLLHCFFWSLDLVCVELIVEYPCRYCHNEVLCRWGCDWSALLFSWGCGSDLLRMQSVGKE